VPLRSAWSLVLVFVLVLVLVLLLRFLLVLVFVLVFVLVLVLVLVLVFVLVLRRLLDALEDHDGQAGAALEVLGAVLGVGLGVAVLDGVAVDLVDALDGLLVGRAAGVGAVDLLGLLVGVDLVGAGGGVFTLIERPLTAFLDHLHLLQLGRVLL